MWRLLFLSSEQSVQFSRSFVSDSLWPHGCSTPGFPVHHQPLEPAQTHVHWVGDAIQPSHPLVPSSSYLQSFPASGSFPMSRFFTSGGQSIGVSASTSGFSVNIQDWFPFRIEWFDLLAVQGILRVFSNTTVQKDQFFLWCLALFIVQLSHPYMTTAKPIALTRQNFVCKKCLYFLISCLGLS